MCHKESPSPYDIAMLPQILFVIPARIGSQRLPRKMLAKLSENKILLQATYERVLSSKYYDKRQSNVFIATDDVEIESESKKFGAKVVLTSPSCLSGSDRIAQALDKIEMKPDVVVNVQGDEPFLDYRHLDLAIDGLMKNQWADVSTCAIKYEDNLILKQDISKVKVVFSSRNHSALYFSRSPIPYDSKIWFKHIGIYCYRPSILKIFSKESQTPLEQVERLEQLRLLELGYKVLVVEVTALDWRNSLSVDTEEDLKNARKVFQKCFSPSNSQ